MQVWNPQQLRDAFERALSATDGTARFALSDESTALAFRRALYRFRAKADVGWDCVLEQTENIVTIRRVTKPTITPLNPNGEPEIIDEEGLLG